MVESARLESVYTFIAYRGFESLFLRHFSLSVKQFRAKSGIRARLAISTYAPTYAPTNLESTAKPTYTSPNVDKCRLNDEKAARTNVRFSTHLKFDKPMFYLQFLKI